MSRTEINFFCVAGDEVDGGDSANAPGYGIHTQGGSVEDVRRNVLEAVDCLFGDTRERPNLIGTHLVRGAILVA